VTRAGAGAGQAASRENARAGGAAEALSKQLVKAKVENCELTRRLNKALQAEQDMRHMLAQRTHQPVPSSPAKQAQAGAQPSAFTVTFSSKARGGSRESSPHKASALRLSGDTLRHSSEGEGEGSALALGMAAAVAEAQAQLAAQARADAEDEVGGGGGDGDGGGASRADRHEVHKWLERSVRLQTECEAAVLAKVVALLHALAHAAQPLPRGRAGASARPAGVAARDMEEASEALSQALADQLRKKRALVSSVSSAPPRARERRVGAEAGWAASLAAMVGRQAEAMSKYRQEAIKHMSLLRQQPEALAAAAPRAHLTGQSVARSASPAKSKAAGKQQAEGRGRAAAGQGGPDLKIKDPLSGRLQRDLKEARNKLVEQSSKHALEVDRLKKQLSEARVDLSMAHMQQAHAGADADEARRGQPPEDALQLVEMCAELRQQCKQLEQTAGAWEAEAAAQRQQRLALEQRLGAAAAEHVPPPCVSPPASPQRGARVQQSSDSLASPPRAPAQAAQAGGDEQSAKASKTRATEDAQRVPAAAAAASMTPEELRDEVVALRSQVYQLRLAEEHYRRTFQDQRAHIAHLSSSSSLAAAAPPPQHAAATMSAPASGTGRAEARAHDLSDGEASVRPARLKEAWGEGGRRAEAVVDTELEQAATSLASLDLTASIHEHAHRQVAAAQDELRLLQARVEQQEQARREQAGREEQLQRDLEALRAVCDKDAQQGAAAAERHAALEAQCALLRGEREAADEQLREAVEAGRQAAARADHIKVELIEAVREVEHLRAQEREHAKAQERERTRHLEVVRERDAVVDKLQAAVARLEAAAVGSRAAPPAEVEALRQERDEARAAVAAVQDEHQQAMEALRRQIARNDNEHQLLHHDRQSVIEVAFFFWLPSFPTLDPFRSHFPLARPSSR